MEEGETENQTVSVQARVCACQEGRLACLCPLPPSPLSSLGPCCLLLKERLTDWWLM